MARLSLGGSCSDLSGAIATSSRRHGWQARSPPCSGRTRTARRVLTKVVDRTPPSDGSHRPLANGSRAHVSVPRTCQSKDTRAGRKPMRGSHRLAQAATRQSPAGQAITRKWWRHRPRAHRHHFLLINGPTPPAARRSPASPSAHAFLLPAAVGSRSRRGGVTPPAGFRPRAGPSAFAYSTESVRWVKPAPNPSARSSSTGSAVPDPSARSGSTLPEADDLRSPGRFQCTLVH